MPTPMDFPPSPALGQKFTNSLGVTYEWDGLAWVVGFIDTTGRFDTLGDFINQVRILLQDTGDPTTYRYTTESIVAAANQGLLEMYRLRPDIFLGLDFQIPWLDFTAADAVWPLEFQWVPTLIYYTVGVVQLRDEEGTQDNRASAFMSRFTAQLTGISA